MYLITVDRIYLTIKSMQEEFSLNSEKYYQQHIEISASPLTKLLMNQGHPQSSQIYSKNKADKATHSTGQPETIDLIVGQSDSEKHKCYPKFLSWLGNLCTPCKILCPWCFCNCCCCVNTPLFRQQVQSKGLLQQWGTYKKTLQPGLHVINPISQNILQINQQTHLLQYHQFCISKDNVQFEANVVVFYRVIDSLKLAYRMGSHRIQEGVKEISEGLLRSVAGQNTLQNIIENRSLVSKKLTEQINKMVAYWGIYVQVTSLKQIKLPKQIQDALQTVAQTKRSSQAMLINYRSQVSCAALYKQISQIINTKAAYQIRFLNMVQQVLSNGNPNVVVIRTKLQDKDYETQKLDNQK